VSLPVAILAGGMAMRLRPVTEQIPKSLVEVAGKPFIIHQLELLSQCGLTNVVICVGYLGEKVEKEIGDGHHWNMKVDYVFDGPILLGTGGALRRALPILGNAFFVLYGDSYLECDYSAVEKAFHESGKLGLMTVNHNVNQWDQSNVMFDSVSGKIIRYDKLTRSCDMQHIDYGLGILTQQALIPYLEGAPLDLASVYQDLLANDQLAGYEMVQRFYEIGSQSGLEETDAYLRGKGKQK